MLWARFATALILAPTVVILVVVGDPWYSLAVALVAGLGAWELHGLLEAMGARVPPIPQIALSLLVVGAALTPIPAAPWAAAALGTVLSAAIALARNAPPEQRVLTWASMALSALYTGWLPAHFILLRQLPGASLPVEWLPFALPAGARWVLFALLITWCTDIAAYAAGRAFGRHRMSPALSPRKTWEGAAAGVAACALAPYPLSALLSLPLSTSEGAFLGIILSVLGQLGDLAESLLKRAGQAKDSSRLLPGHGGLLDRMDSLLFTVACVYYYAVFLKP